MTAFNLKWTSRTHAHTVTTLLLSLKQWGVAQELEEGCRKARGGQGETFTIISSDSNLLQNRQRWKKWLPERDGNSPKTVTPQRWWRDSLQNR